jgi:hypothetical protein
MHRSANNVYLFLIFNPGQNPLSSRHLVYVLTTALSMFVPFFQAPFWLSERKWCLAPVSFRTCTLCAARGELNRLDDRPRNWTHMATGQERNPLYYYPPHSSPYYLRPSQLRKISLAPLLLSAPWQCRSLMFCCKRGRTLSTRASKISTASPLLPCTLATPIIHTGELTPRLTHYL